jgi:UDP-glucose/iron transport system permease protein
MLPVVESAAMASRSIIEVSWFDLAWAGGLMLIAVGISHWQKLGLAQRLVIGAIRTVVQLMLVGYALVYIFALDRWYLVGVALLGMLLVATRAAVNRQFRASRTLLMITGVAMLLASGLTLLYISTLVVRVTPWYNPQYLIPLFGMIIGSAMNAAAIAAERLASEIAARTAEIEAYLALGATAQQASQQPVRQALRAALMPTVNGLMVLGIVTLPGMMTGQMLVGASPLIAIRYQIVVAFMQAAAVAITTAIVTLWYRRTFFTSALQLKVPTNAAAA